MKLCDLPPAITPTNPVCPSCGDFIPRPPEPYRPLDPCAWVSLQCARCDDVFRGRFFVPQDERSPSP